MPAISAVVPVEYSNVEPGSNSRGCPATNAAALGAAIISRISLVGVYSSVHSSPLDICSSWRSVMAWRGSPGRTHSGRGGCSSSDRVPSATSMPTRADVKLLATENESLTTSGPSSGW